MKLRSTLAKKWSLVCSPEQPEQCKLGWGQSHEVGGPLSKLNCRNTFRNFLSGFYHHIFCFFCTVWATYHQLACSWASVSNFSLFAYFSLLSSDGVAWEMDVCGSLQARKKLISLCATLWPAPWYYFVRKKPIYLCATLWPALWYNCTKKGTFFCNEAILNLSVADRAFKQSLLSHYEIRALVA